ncbi:rRNA adenine N(6)-methyltransferase family protein [Microlunatus parietis]|uniref:23S rRNA (Adenine-N6)-dimethyltransferase n=1 Tax=Microlunatus parietis TaxID=682979 RepID=A0A7Y9I7Z9_9ACTN|nr:rRNA adenine N-6-methyltransferase family protein [Microlunatus parietis]NYE71434.1 23S rRNA (adenine-N6)-dimethyltransferase [Microlunatus parietis]
MSGAGRRRPSTRREWAWHQLDPEWAGRLVDQAEVRPGQLVVEFGAGTGAVTAPLLDSGARVIAIEWHPGRAAALQRRFGSAAANGTLKVLGIDALDFRLPARPFRVIANPPYSITSALLRLITARHSRMIRADLVLQRGAVNGLLERPPRWFVGVRGVRVPRWAFAPPPEVDSAVLTLRRRR